MNKNLLTWLAVIVVIILAVVLIKGTGNKIDNSVNNGGSSEATYPAGDTSNPNPGPADTGATSLPSTPSTPTSSTPGTVKSFTVTGSNFSFTPNTLTVNKGDTVKITFVNQNGMHDWVLDEFNATTKVIQGGQSETIEFVADKTGTFEYYCSVGTHRQMGMKGTLTVK